MANIPCPWTQKGPSYFNKITGVGFSFDSRLRLFMGKWSDGRSPGLTLTMFAQFNLALRGKLVHITFNVEEKSINEC